MYHILGLSHWFHFCYRHLANNRLILIMHSFIIIKNSGYFRTRPTLRTTYSSYPDGSAFFWEFPVSYWLIRNFDFLLRSARGPQKNLKLFWTPESTIDSGSFAISNDFGAYASQKINSTYRVIKKTSAFHNPSFPVAPAEGRVNIPSSRHCDIFSFQIIWAKFRENAIAKVCIKIDMFYWLFVNIFDNSGIWNGC